MRGKRLKRKTAAKFPRPRPLSSAPLLFTPASCLKILSSFGFSMRHFDMVIIGAGPGGYAAALAASKKGQRVALVEKNALGGTCLNWGCIPTKLFLGATQSVAELEAQSRLRLCHGAIHMDLGALQKRKHAVLAATQKAMRNRLAQANVTLLSGTAILDEPGLLNVTGAENTRLRFETLILATGSRPAAPTQFAPDHERILDPTDMLNLEEPPQSLAIIGAGAIGLEMAELWSRLGARIHLIEAADRIAPAEDPEISAVLQTMLRKKWAIRTGASVQQVRRTDTDVVLSVGNSEEIQAQMVLVAVGRTPNADGLGLENHGAIQRPKGWIQTNAFLQAAPHVYAVGDVNGRTLLAHAAEHQGRYAIAHALGETKAPYAPGPIPSCIYGSIEVLHAGKTVPELKAQGRSVRVSRANPGANPIAQSHGHTQGLVKIVWSDGAVQGVSAVGHGVSHLITLAEIMVQDHWSVERAEQTIFAHPTLDEALLAALLADQEDV